MQFMDDNGAVYKSHSIRMRKMKKGKCDLSFSLDYDFSIFCSFLFVSIMNKWRGEVMWN